MSLRFRLNLFITILFLLIFAGGSFYVIEIARNSVRSEVQSSAHLALQLINIALTSSKGSNSIASQTQVVEQIARLESIRHLDIEIYRANNPFQSKQSISGKTSRGGPRAPAWFVRLVKPPPMEFTHKIKQSGTQFIEVIVRANPSDEITEVWDETRGILALMVLFVVLANVLVYVTLGRGLAPIESILRGLEGIEHGDYDLRLPAFNLHELSRISEKFNLMAGVLQRSKEDNRILTQRSLAIQEDERRNLAYELHDELGQSITAIKAVAVSIEQQSAPNPVSVKESASTIISVSNHMYNVARNMMRRLRPPTLDELGLITTLQDMIDDWNSRHQEIFCSFSFNGELNRLNEETNISLYRIIQESLTNIVKHSGAVAVTIHLETVYSPATGKADGEIVLTITDDGRGFDVANTRPGLGLLGMRERSEALRGKIQIDSVPGQGVTITITIPVAKNP
ncbi:MAG TPA: ATP-binding protein [Gammaproteobacteria bacterium]|nr:ATP-binding protein [Gammaproteobacteria bacterium]